MGAARSVEPRVMVVEGRRVLVVDRRPPLPATLDQLVRAMRVTYWRPLARAGGATHTCLSDQDHRLQPFLEGRHAGTDGRVRDLRLLMCADCEAVCVRDVSLDTDRHHDPAGRGFARRPGLPWRRADYVLGWYTGARRRQRTYT